MAEKIIRIGWIHDLFHDEDEAIWRASDGRYMPGLAEGLRVTTDAAKYEFWDEFDSRSISYMNIEDGDELERIYTNGKNTIVLCTNGHKLVFNSYDGTPTTNMHVVRNESIDLTKEEYHATL